MGSEGSQARQGIGPGSETSSEQTYGFAALANHPASCGRGHSDVGFQLHLFFRVKEVFFFQFPKDPPLGLREQDMTGDSPSVQSTRLLLEFLSPATAQPSPKLTGARHREAMNPALAWQALLLPCPLTALCKMCTGPLVSSRCAHNRLL